MTDRLIYDTRTGTLTLDGEVLDLPRKERELLVYLIEHPDIVHKKEELIRAVWGYASLGQSSTLTVHVNRLRRKLEQDPRSPNIIECVWGVGYKLRSGKVTIL